MMTLTRAAGTAQAPSTLSAASLLSCRHLRARSSSAPRAARFLLKRSHKLSDAGQDHAAFVKADRLLYPHGALPIEACIESFHEHDLATNNRPDASPSETNRAVS
jgi:hypothetical protein